MSSTATPSNATAQSTPPLATSLCFFALGDFGVRCPRIEQLASAMDEYARTVCAPDFILGLGDNFYPNGVSSVDDRKFQVAWSDVFLAHPTLRVPWRLILGNHDYQTNPQAQIDFTHDKRNVGGYWQMPAPTYSFSCTIKDGRDTASNDTMNIDFFAFDTNGVQGDIQRRFPDSQRWLLAYRDELKEQLDKSKARVKIVYAHHPMYTAGRNHGQTGRCLRDVNYTLNDGRTAPGYGMEDIFVGGRVNGYFTGHEHVLQHVSKRGIDHFVIGGRSGFESGEFYGGRDMNTEMSWTDQTFSTGFVVCVISATEMRVRFVSSDMKVLHEVVTPLP